MLYGQLLHPEILEGLASAGHSSKVLIADGNYPFRTRCGPLARRVHLNLSPGVISVTQALAALLSAVPIEAAAVMDYPNDGPYSLEADPPIWSEFQSLLNASRSDCPELQRIERFEFYEAASGSDVALLIATADQRIFANLLLTLGVVFPS
jgi:L-fucose mutarotase